MNKIFSFKRVALLLKNQWYENASIYMIGIVLTIALSIVMFWGNFSYWELEYDFPYMQRTVLFLSGILALLAFGATFFNKLHAKQKGMFYASLPVLTLERVVAAFICLAVIAPLLFLLIFNVIDFVAVQIFNQIHETTKQMLFRGNIPSVYSIFTIFLALLSFSSISAFWSLLFGKKGAIATVFFIVISIMIYALTLGWLIKKGFYENPSDNINISIGEGDDFFIYLIPIWWILMYFIMKRKEVK